MTFMGLMRLADACRADQDLDIDTRRENQFCFSEPWQMGLQRVLEGNERCLVQSSIPLSDPTSFFILKCDDLWKNQVTQKLSHLFITTKNF